MYDLPKAAARMHEPPESRCAVSALLEGNSRSTTQVDFGKGMLSRHEKKFLQASLRSSGVPGIGWQARQVTLRAPAQIAHVHRSIGSCGAHLDSAAPSVVQE